MKYTHTFDFQVEVIDLQLVIIAVDNITAVFLHNVPICSILFGLLLIELCLFNYLVYWHFKKQNRFWVEQILHQNKTYKLSVKAYGETGLVILYSQKLHNHIAKKMNLDPQTSL